MSDTPLSISSPLVRVSPDDWAQLESDLLRAWGRPLDEWFRNRSLPFSCVDAVGDMQIMSVGTVVFGDPPACAERRAPAGYDARPMVLRSFCLDLVRVR